MQRHRHVNIQPLHACAGVLCDVHATCVRYAFVDGSTEPSCYWLGTCAPYGAKVHPGYIDVDFIGPPHPRHYLLTRRDAGQRRRPIYNAETTA